MLVLRRSATSSASSIRTMASKAPITYTPGPVESSIHRKLNEGLKPTLIRISNDSSKHAHHSAMRAQGGGNGETHFAVQLISPAFDSLPQIKRHRMVNSLLKEEFEEKGLHALSLKLRSQAEVNAELAKHGLGSLEDQLEEGGGAAGRAKEQAGVKGEVVGEAGFDGHGNDVQHKAD